MYSLTMCWEGDLRMQVTQGVLSSLSGSTLRHRGEIGRVNSKTLPLALNHSLGRRLIVTQWLLAHRVRNLGHPPTATKVMCWLCQ